MEDEQSGAVDAVVEDGGQAETVTTEQPKAAPDASDYVSAADFKRMQSVLDRQIAEEKKRRAEVEAKLREISLQNIPEDERETAKLRQDLEAQQAQLAQYQRENALRQLSTEYGVPFEQLQDAQTPEQAWGIALQHMKAQIGSGGQASQVAPTPQEPQPVTTPFIAPQQAGGNKARDWDKEFEAAEEAKDSRLYARLLREYKQATNS